VPKKLPNGFSLLLKFLSFSVHTGKVSFVLVLLISIWDKELAHIDTFWYTPKRCHIYGFKTGVQDQV
jgi:hypothetical protein